METEILASTILSTFEEARSQLIGKSVVLTDGKAGTVENVWLDELHGLRVSIKGHDGKWPVSTVKLAQSWSVFPAYFQPTNPVVTSGRGVFQHSAVICFKRARSMIPIGPDFRW